MGTRNSRIRKIILTEHAGLRAGLGAIEALLDQVVAGDKAARAEAHQQLVALLQTFLRHIEHEERILQPVLEVIDEWGPERRARMDQEHKLQRGQVTQLAGAHPDADPAAWAREVRSFAKELLRDMDDEEMTCLSPTVLRDQDDALIADGTSS